MSSVLKRLTTLLLSLALTSPALAADRSPPVAAKQTTLYVLIDGMRADSVTPDLAPNLYALSERGVKGALTPVFPSVSRPNHWALATGLNARSSGVSANDVYNTHTGRNFDPIDPEYWGTAEPIWETLNRAGRQSGVIGPWNGVERIGPDTNKPTFFIHSGWFLPEGKADRRGALTLELLSQDLEILSRPGTVQPDLLALYMADVDHAQHGHGVGSPEALTAIRVVDRVIGDVLDGLTARGLTERVNIVVVSDHGQMNITNLIVLSDFVDPLDFLIPPLGGLGGTSQGLWPRPDREAKVLAQLREASPHLKIYGRGELPIRFDCCRADRTAPVYIIPDPGWVTVSKPPSAGENPIGKGTHGWDNQTPEMQAVFVAAGPAIRAGTTPKAPRSVDVYSLIAALTDVKPNANDGALTPFCGILKNPPKSCRS